MSTRSETFGRLLKGAINSIATYEGKTAPIIEEELAEKVHLAGSAIQRYKAGHLPPEPRTVEVIAEAAIRRGFFGREWLQRFLHAARYHHADKLLDQLCPIGPARPRPPRVYQNLPAPTYSQFVMREAAFAEVLEGLSQRSAAVIVVGLGGNGKTSLAREVADSCIKRADGATLFDAAVWISDKDCPGTTNLSTVLDEIARTLDYPGFTQFEHDEKRREIEQLLRRQCVLVCIDNFETVTDGALLEWLLKLPEPSKALITTREYRREYRRGGWPVELRGMSDLEARELVDERLRVLRIEKMMNGRAELDPLIAGTGGNPKAIEMTLGLMKHERQTLKQVVDYLYAARGRLFDDLFTRAWALLDDPARRALLVMTFFPASVCEGALRATADVEGHAFESAVDRLADLALLDVQYISLHDAPRYTLHPLVRSYAQARLLEQVSFEDVGRTRWINWYLALASEVGFCWNDLQRLNLLDSEQEAIMSVIQWTFDQRRYSELFELARGVRYYHDVRGLWDRMEKIDKLCLAAAQAKNDSLAEVEALASHVAMLCHQGHLTEAEKHFAHLSALVEAQTLDPRLSTEVQQAFFLYWRVKGNLDYAVQVCQHLLDSDDTPVFARIAARHWLAGCYYKQGQLAKATSLYEKTIEEATKEAYQRFVIFARCRMVTIHLDLGHLIDAELLLDEVVPLIYHHQDRRYIARVKRLLSRLHALRGDSLTAEREQIEANELFERLGMRSELSEAREELRCLETDEVPMA